MKTVQYTTTRTAFRDTHHPQIRPSIPRITLPMSLQPRNCVVLKNHSISSLTVCIVGKRDICSKDPKRWRPAYLCQSTVSEQDKTSYKQYLLEKCASRDDVLAEEVRSRVVGLVSDLHAAEARYHKDCMCRFFANRLLSTGNEGGPLSPRSQYQHDMAWKHMVTTLSNDQKRVWNTVERQQEYQDHGGVDLTRSQLANTTQMCNYNGGNRSEAG